MSNIIVKGTQEFLGKEIPIVEGGFGVGKRCLTDKVIGEIHSTKVIHVRESINRNIKRFKENIDYIDLKTTIDMNDSRKILKSLSYTDVAIRNAKHIYLLSERGYSKLIKIMDTDLAWEIHDKLMDEYFTMREIINSSDVLKGQALLKVAEGLTMEERINGCTEYAKIRVEEETKPLLDTIGRQNDVIADIVDTHTSYENLRRELVANIQMIGTEALGCSIKDAWNKFYKFLFGEGYNLNLRRTNLMRQADNKSDEYYNQRKALIKELDELDNVTKVMKRNTDGYRANRLKIKEMKKNIKELEKNEKLEARKFAKLEKCSKLDLIKEDEFEDIVIKTRAWSIGLGYNWKEGLINSEDITLPF